MSELTATDSTAIDFEKYEVPVEASGRDVPKALQDWKDTDLGSQLMRNIESAKYTKPTPIQRNSLPIVIAGRDLMGCAQTGSGKTAAFLLPILAKILKNLPVDNRTYIASPLAVVLAPTRELACQIYDEAVKFSKGSPIRSCVAYGGVPIGGQIRLLERGCEVLIATPGRLVDIVKRDRANLKAVRFLVLDEADRMLDMGFEPQIREIVETFGMPTTGKRQTLMFSATFAKEVQMLAANYLHDYVFLTVGRVGSTTELVTQKFVQVADDREKESKLIEMLSTMDKGLILIFVETKQRANILERLLTSKGFPATAIHGDKDQGARTWALKSFSTGKKPILIATNVAARGLDVNGITHVINVDMPREIDSYVHRIGRTGRAGKVGISITFIGPTDGAILPSLLSILQDSNQEVPEWLQDMKRDRRFSGRGGRGGGRGGSRFGGRDFRSQSGSSQRPSYSSAPARSAPFPFAPNPYQQASVASYSNPYSAPSAYPQPYAQVPHTGYQQPQPPRQPYPVASAPYPPKDNGYASSGYAPRTSSSSYGSSTSSYGNSTSSYVPEKRRADSDSYSNDREKYRKTDSSYDNRRPVPPKPSSQYGF